MATVPSVTTAPRILDSTPSSSTTDFTIAWVVIGDSETAAKDDLQVWVDGTGYLTSNDFTFTGNAVSRVSGIWNGGTVTLDTAVNGKRVVITSARTPRRTGQFLEGKAFYASALDTLMNDFAVQMRDLRQRADQSLRVPVRDVAQSGGVLSELPDAATRKNTFLGFDGSGNTSLVAGIPEGITTVGPFTKIVFASAYDTLDEAHTAAVAAGASLLLDANFTLSADTTPSAKIIGAGGKITLGSSDLSGAFWAPPTTQLFDATGSGTLTLSAPCPQAYEKWFGVARDGSISDTAATASAIGGIPSGSTLLENAGTSVRSNWNTSIVPASGVTLKGGGRGTTVDAYSSTSTFLYAITQSNSHLDVKDLAISVSGPVASGMQFVSWAADDLKLLNLEFDGKMTNGGGSVTSGTSNLLKPSTTGTVKGLSVTNVKAHDCYSVYGKANADTGVQSFIRVKDCELYNNYGGDLQFNSPLGSQTDIVVERCYIHDPIYIAAYAGRQMGIAIACGDDIRVLYNRIDGDYYQAIHFEDAVTNFSIVGNRGTISTSGIMLRPASATKFPQKGEVAGNNFSQSGTPRETPNYGIGIDSHGTGWAGAKNVDIHDNIIEGSGFAAGYLISGQYTDGPSLNRLHHNTAIGTAIGLYFPDNSVWGGIDIADNTTDGCPIHIKAAMALIESHNFKNCDPAAVTSVPFRGVNSTFNFIALKHGRFSFATVNIGASGTQDFAIVRLGANDRFAGSVTLHAQENTSARMGTAFYAQVAWDGSSAPTFTNLAGEAAHNITVTASKKTISGVDYLVATVTNGLGAAKDIALTANIDGMYTYYGT